MKPPSVSRARPGSSSKSSDLSFTIAATLMQSFDPPAPLLHNSGSAGVSSRSAVAATADQLSCELSPALACVIRHLSSDELRTGRFYLPADFSF